MASSRNGSTDIKLTTRGLAKLGTLKKIGLARCVAPIDRCNRKNFRLVLTESANSVSMQTLSAGHHRKCDLVAEEHPVFKGETDEHLAAS
ncbi:MAG: hypothetical protein IK079_05975 [Desulfovibrio sp.]|nr:hypothetical protein [Desulfovibrio sp.]